MTLLDQRNEPVRDMRLEPVTQQNSLIDVIERLVTNPAADVAKLRELIDMQREIVREQARVAFEADFVDMQKELPIIAEKGEIKVNGSLRSKFAKHEDIIEIVRPILAKWGFSLRHKNEQQERSLTITAILSHRAGHQVTDTFVCPPDNSGGKNDVQAMGSTREYGRRYTTESILNIVTRAQDNDAQSASKKPETTETAPAGYVEFLQLLESEAMNGTAKMMACWNKAHVDQRNYLIRTDRKRWEAIKTTAAEVGAKK
jgi:hypothetical protein